MPSYDWNPSDPPSAQLKAMASIWRGNEPLNIGEMEWALRMSFASACRRIDSEFCEPEILKTLALHLRCQPRYLHAIHNAHRRDVLHVSDAAAAKIAQQRIAEAKATAKKTHEGRIRESRVA